MKAKTMAESLKNPINLSKSPVRFTPTGSIERVAQRGRTHPGVEGRLAGEARMTKNPPHAGEMHPDGDELLYLVEGAINVILDEEAGERCLSLQPGQAFVVPCGVWHRVMVREPRCLPLAVCRVTVTLAELRRKTYRVGTAPAKVVQNGFAAHANHSVRAARILVAEFVRFGR
jgi:mannose-6-phosphate isomerase-like protein (cupin superfamily)